MQIISSTDLTCLHVNRRHILNVIVVIKVCIQTTRDVLWHIFSGCTFLTITGTRMDGLWHHNLILVCAGIVFDAALMQLRGSEASQQQKCMLVMNSQLFSTRRKLKCMSEHKQRQKGQKHAVRNSQNTDEQVINGSHSKWKKVKEVGHVWKDKGTFVDLLSIKVFVLRLRGS